MFKTKYRVVSDWCNDWGVQKRLWWCPFWIDVTSYSYSKEQAIERAKNCKQSPIYV